MILSIKDGEAKVAIDGEKFLRLLGISMEKVESSEGATIVCNKLLSLSEEERIQLFNKSKMSERRVIDMALIEKTELDEARKRNIALRGEGSGVVVFRLTSPFYIDTDRSVKEIKKELKRCNNYMQRRKLEQELQAAYKNAKAGLVV